LHVRLEVLLGMKLLSKSDVHRVANILAVAEEGVDRFVGSGSDSSKRSSVDGDRVLQLAGLSEKYTGNAGFARQLRRACGERDPIL
jgi:hypothetical protein